MPRILMIAEKPSLAQSLAEILSNGNMHTRKGMNGACSVHQFNGSFQGISNCFFKFTSVCGHIMNIDFISSYNDWNKTEPIELFDAPIIKKEANPKLKMSEFLQHEAKNCDILVLWLDCDKEGENICFEIIDLLSKTMRLTYSNPQTVFRARFSSITKNDIMNAFNNLYLPNELLSLCVDARQEIDLRLGCSFTRLQTKFFHDKYGDLDSSLISYGPCQTPTLRFCVERHDKILSFEYEPYYVLDVSVKSENYNNVLNLEWERGREFNVNLANQYFNQVKNQKSVKIISIDKLIKTKVRPQALNTVNLLKVASFSLGIGSHQTMQIAERLYTQGYISYPRTESTHYSVNFDLLGTLKIQQNHSDWGDYVKNLISVGINKPRSGQDFKDHPPITPMRIAHSNDLDKDSWRIYNFITRNFIGSISPNLIYENLSIVFEIGNEKFSKNGNKVLNPGFTEIITWQAISDDSFLSYDLNKKDNFQILDTKLTEKRTTPPPYLSEFDLITLMEKNGIGTDASIPQHINNIFLRNFVKITNDRRFIPTQLGIVLVHGYQRIDSELVLPTSRANVEKILNQISTGERDFHTVLKEIIVQYKAKFKFFLKNINLMDELFQDSFSSLAETGKPFSKCGVCRRYLKFISKKPQRLYCQTCTQTFSLPQNGNIQTFKNDKCPLDNFALLQFSSTVNDKNYVFCPQCFNNPPYSDMIKASPCIACTNKDCDKGMIKNQIRICLKCKYNGKIVLESWSGPSRWRFVCTKCDFIIYGLKNAHTVKVINDKNCKNCSAYIVQAIFNEKELIGCIFCDKQMLGMLAEKKSKSKHNNFNSNSNSIKKNDKKNLKKMNRNNKESCVDIHKDPNDSEEETYRFKGKKEGSAINKKFFSRRREKNHMRFYNNDNLNEYQKSSLPIKISVADYIKF